MQDTLYQNRSNSQNEATGFTIKDMFFKYVRFLPLLMLSVAIALLIAFMYLRYATPIYRALGTLVIKNENNLNRNDEFENLIMPSGSQNILSEVEVLKSRPLMERVVRTLNLQTTYYAVGKIKDPNIYKDAPFELEILKIEDSSRSFTQNLKFPNNNEFRVNNNSKLFTFGQVYQNEFGVFRLKLKPGKVPGREYNITWNPEYTAASRYVSAVVVNPNPIGTSILDISVETPNPELSADIVNQLMVEYQKANIEEQKQTAIQTLEFIDNRLLLLDKELDSVKRMLLSFQQVNDLVDEDQQSSLYFNLIGETDRQLMEINRRANLAQLLQDYISTSSYSLVPSSLSLEDPTLNALVIEYNKLQQERNALLESNVPEQNVLVKDITSRLNETRKSLLENLRNIRQSYSVQANQLRRSNTSLEAQAKALPEKVQRKLEIERLVSTKEELYKLLMEKQAETAISQASTISNSKILDKARPNSNPVKPNRLSVQILAILVGLGLPTMIIFIRELLNDKITTRHDIERLTQAAVLGEIGHSFADDTLVVDKTSRGMVAEQFRIIRSNLQYILHHIEKPVLMVTSSFSGEGKSFVSTNMGAVMALAGKKTVVLEFDIRKPKILSGLGLPRQSGITNFVLGKAAVQELPMLVEGYDSLYVIGCGPVPPNPSELLLDEKVDELFNYLKKEFDVIIIDTAPVGMVSDAMTLSKYADATMYIVRQGYTYKRQISLIDEFYREQRLPKISIVINDVRIKPGYGYYGYGRYGYGYGYGAGYYEEATKPKTFASRMFGWMNGNKKRRSRKRVSA